VTLEGGVQSLGIDVERVRILHRELAHAKHTRLRARLVAVLLLDLVPDLRKLFVTAQFGGQRGEHLFAGHAEPDIGAFAIRQPEHLFAHRLPASTALPEIRGLYGRQQKLLGSNAVHFFTGDLLDFLTDAKAKREQRVDARHQLTDKARSHQEFVADGFGVGRIVAQCRDEELRPAHERPTRMDHGNLTDTPETRSSTQFSTLWYRALEGAASSGGRLEKRRPDLLVDGAWTTGADGPPIE